jgi:hypothetical protein
VYEQSQWSAWAAIAAGCCGDFCKIADGLPGSLSDRPRIAFACVNKACERIKLFLGLDGREINLSSSNKQ